MGWEQRKPSSEEWAQAEKESGEKKATKSAADELKKRAEKAGLSESEKKIAQEAPRATPQGIDSISLNPDTMIKTSLRIAKAEAKLERRGKRSAE